MKLLITDDQTSVHKFLDLAIDWKKLGITEILHAYNGKDCINQINHSQPDIMLLDIKMPVLDGIQVLEYIQTNHLAVEVIILTAFDEFHYAQAAIKSGASDYIVKPINTDELYQSLSRVIHRIRNNRRHALNELVLGRTVLANSDEFLSSFELSSFLGILIRSAQLKELQKIFSDELYLLTNDNNLLLLFPSDMQTHYETILLFRKRLQAYDYDNKIQTVNCLYSVSDIFLSFSLSTIQEALDHCKQALEAHFYFYEEHEFIYRPFNVDFDHKKMQEYKENIIAAILNFSRKEHITEEINAFMNYLKTQYLAPDKTISLTTQTYIEITTSVFIRLHTGEQFQMNIENFSNVRTIEELKDVFNLSVLQNIQQYNTNEPASKDGFLEDLNAYLLQNIDQPLSLDDISQHFLISKYELCRRYKQFSGETIWEHLTNIKMEKAKTLLKNSDLSIIQISQLTGYNDSTYFSKAFKKYWGYSPKHYRDSAY